MKKRILISLLLVLSIIMSPILMMLGDVVLADELEIVEMEDLQLLSDNLDASISDAIGELREYYSEKDLFTFRSALAYHYTSDNLEVDLIEIGSKFKVNEKPDSASAYVGNIMGLIAAGKDPYKHNNENYVKTLIDSQNENGKFMIGEYDDYPTTQAFSVLALDMANGDYDKKKAIDALLSYQDEGGSFGGEFGGVDETGMILGALGKYKDESKVNASIDRALNYLKGEQDEDTGGFITFGSESPHSASAVIQGLVAVGEDPLSKEWTKGDKTMVNSLLSFYKGGYFESVSEWGTDIDSVTEQGLLALADLYRGKSIFNELRLDLNLPARISIEMPNIVKIIEGDIIKLVAIGYDKDEKILPLYNLIWASSDEEIATIDINGNLLTKKSGKVNIKAKVEGTSIEDNIEIEVLDKEFEIEYIGDASVQKGKQADAKVKMRNLTLDIKSATLIIGLYEKNNNKLINYSTIKRNLESKEEIELSAAFLVPEMGEYYIKAFLWDDLETQNIIMKETKDLKIAN